MLHTGILRNMYKTPPTHGQQLSAEPRLFQVQVHGRFERPGPLVPLGSHMVLCELLVSPRENGQMDIGHPDIPLLFEVTSGDVSIMQCSMSCNNYVMDVSQFLMSHDSFCNTFLGKT